MKEQFLQINFRAERLRLIEVCNRVIETYLQQGFKLTLRQLYYQLVTENIIPNEERAYKSVGKLVSDGRLAGLIDWDAIEDRARIPRIPQEFENLRDLVNVALSAYRLPRWQGQFEYVELWVEKDALSGVLAPLATQYHVSLMVNRGYSSQSAMYEAAQRFIEKGSENGGRNGILLYLGDHDPSGEDMVRDIEDRLKLLTSGLPIEVIKVALTWEQVESYSPPPNPTKLTDSRSTGYIAKYGDECWEVDALRPDVLQSIICESIEPHLVKEQMDLVKDREEKDKARLRAFVKGLSNE